MSDEAPKPRRRWLIWAPLGCLGILLVSVGLLTVVVATRAGRRWRDFTPRHDAVRARVLGRPAERPVVEGTGLAGDAWPGYVASAAALNGMTKDEKNAIEDAFERKALPDVEKNAWAVLDAHAADLAALRAATKAGSFRPVLAWEKGFAMELPWVSPLRFAGRLLALSARRHRLEGNLDAALDDVAAGLQVGLDFRRSNLVIGALCGNLGLRFALVEAKDIALEKSLTAAQSKRLEDMLAVAESSLPSILGPLEGERFGMGETFRGVVEDRSGAYDGLADLGNIRLLAWRQGFSMKIVAADADDACARLAAAARDVADRPWPEAQQRYREVEATWRDNAILGMLMFRISGLDNSGRGALARIRLVRALLYERTTGASPAPMPLDPFTIQPLHRNTAGTRVLIWSEGADGDNAGAGEFGVDPSSGGDIVIEWDPAALK